MTLFPFFLLYMYTHRIHGFFSFCYIRIHTVCMCIVWHMLYMYTHVLYVYTSHTWIVLFMNLMLLHFVFMNKKIYVCGVDFFVGVDFFCCFFCMDFFVHGPNAASFFMYDLMSLILFAGQKGSHAQGVPPCPPYAGVCLFLFSFIFLFF